MRYATTESLKDAFLGFAGSTKVGGWSGRLITVKSALSTYPSTKVASPINRILVTNAVVVIKYILLTFSDATDFMKTSKIILVGIISDL